MSSLGSSGLGLQGIGFHVRETQRKVSHRPCRAQLSTPWVVGPTLYSLGCILLTPINANPHTLIVGQLGNSKRHCQLISDWRENDKHEAEDLGERRSLIRGLQNFGCCAKQTRNHWSIDPACCWEASSSGKSPLIAARRSSHCFTHLRCFA